MKEVSKKEGNWKKNNFGYEVKLEILTQTENSQKFKNLLKSEKKERAKNPILSLPLYIIRTGSSTYLNKLVSYFDIEILFNFDGKVTAFFVRKYLPWFFLRNMKFKTME